MKFSVNATLALSMLMSLTQFGCVSLNIQSQKAMKSDGVEFQAPPHPFSALDSSRADGAWQNKGNGNTISYLSDCNDPLEPSQDSVARELFSDLRNVRFRRSESFTYNTRSAVNIEVEGEVEGIATRIHAVVFRKNGCLYTLTFVGVAKSYDDDHVHFNGFLQGFRAP